MLKHYIFKISIYGFSSFYDVVWQSFTFIKPLFHESSNIYRSDKQKNLEQTNRVL